MTYFIVVSIGKKLEENGQRSTLSNKQRRENDRSWEDKETRTESRDFCCFRCSLAATGIPVSFQKASASIIVDTSR